MVVTATTLFTLATVQVVITLVLGAAELREIYIPLQRLREATGIIYGFNKYVAGLSQSLFILSIYSLIADGLVVSFFRTCRRTNK